MYAQGGIAAAIGRDDNIQKHYADTMAAGAGLCDPTAARVLVEQGPVEIERLLQWGADFEHEGNALSLSREGGHGVARIVHGNGGLTGKVVVDTLLARVRADSDRKSTRLNSSHMSISYAVFCLKKKKKIRN